MTLNKLFPYLILITFQCISAFATEMEIRPGVKGIWLKPFESETSDFHWQANWIWLDDASTSQVMLARRTFELESIPPDAILRLTASSQYQLYINGIYICRGPARSASHHQSYDILEISGMLRQGLNTIAVRVHHQKGKYSYHLNERAGLLAQLDIPVKDQFLKVITGPGWKVSPDTGWDNQSPVINRFQQIVTDRVDLNKVQRGWKQITFDDSGWMDPYILMRDTGWPGVQQNATPRSLTPPWIMLVPRDIPYLVEKDIEAVTLVEAVSIDTTTLPSIELSGTIDPEISRRWADFLNNDRPFSLPPSGDETKIWFLLFDFGKIINGMPRLNIEGATGTRIGIQSAPYLMNNTFGTTLLESDFEDKIILSGEKDSWEATYLKPARYLGLFIDNPKKMVQLSSIGIKSLEYPFEQNGLIQSADAPWIKQYMDATALTIQVCTTDGYTDNYRERRQYAQTGYYAALGNYWLFGDRALQRRYLVQVAQEQEANGMMPAYAPAASDDYMVIVDSNCLWIRSLHDYLLYSGDYQTARGLLPAARKLMDLLNSYTNSSGMIDDPPYPYWLDHAMIDRRGANFNLNGHYLGALDDFAKLLQWLNEADSQTFLTRADLLRESLRTHLWDNDKGLFADALIDGERSNMFSEHTNGMALAMRVADTYQAGRIVGQLLANDQHNYVRRASGVIMVTPAMSYFLHKGLCSYGYIEESFQLFRDRFDKMLGSPYNGTLWEEWWLDGTGRTGELQKGRTRSDAQTESAFPPALFAEYLLGISPTRPGMKEVSIYYRRSGLKNIEGIIPTPEGLLEVEWDAAGKERKLIVNIPGDITARLSIESLGVEEGGIIFVNDNRITVNKMETPYLLLTRGINRIRF
jgi:hypothetical protein